MTGVTTARSFVGSFAQLTGVTVAVDDRVYVADSLSGRIYRADTPNATDLGVVFAGPRDLLGQADGTLIVAAAGSIWRLDPATGVKTSVAAFDTLGIGPAGPGTILATRVDAPTLSSVHLINLGNGSSSLVVSGQALGTYYDTAPDLVTGEVVTAGLNDTGSAGWACAHAIGGGFFCHGVGGGDFRSLAVVLPACRNSIDDDGDGLVDDLEDPGCTSSLDDTEYGVPGTAPECDDGIDNDGDGAVDAGADPGCQSANDFSEKASPGSGLDCDDAADNDGDLLVDYPADPGCQGPGSTFEQRQCQDGLDNDSDGRIDFDGGASAGVPPVQQTAPDLQCQDGGLLVGWKNREKPPGPSCGLGPELVLVLPLLAAALRRRRHR